MVAKNLLEANLKLGSFSTSIKVKLTIEDEEFAFLEREDTEIEAEITIKYKANDSVKGNNLFLVYCKDRKKYILCSGEDVEKELAIMKKGSGTRLRVEVCCPYSSELEENLNNTYRVDNWIKLSDEDFGELAMEMVKAREVKTETPKKKKIVVDEKEAKDKEEAKKEKEREEISIGPSMKDENIYPEGVIFLGGELGKLDTKFWLEKLPKKCDYLLDKYILLTIEEGKKVCYGEYRVYEKSSQYDIIPLTEEKIEHLIISLYDYLGEGEGGDDFTIKEANNLLDLLTNDSKSVKRIKDMLINAKENEKYLNTLKMVYEDYYMEIYEKSSEEEVSFIYGCSVKKYCTGNWCYHYNVKDVSMMDLVIHSEQKEYNSYRQFHVNPIISRLPRIISECEEVRNKFKEFIKTPNNSYLNREVEFEKVWMRLLRYH